MVNVSIDINKAVGLAQREYALLAESLAYHVMEDAKKNHTFINRTGKLEGSIHVEKVETDRRGYVVYRVVAGGDAADYAVHVELGTVKMAALPFLRPALLRQMKRFGL